MTSRTGTFFAKSLRNQHKIAAVTVTVGAGFLALDDSLEPTSAESSSSTTAAATPTSTYWEWTRRLSGKFWTEVSTPNIQIKKHSSPATTSRKTKNKQDNDLFEGQCLKRQLHQPKVPYPAWDYDWDGRMTDETSMNAHLSGSAKAVNDSKKTRHIILVRHGQYNEEPEDDSKQKLTSVGRKQAIKTGKRLAAMAKGSAQFLDHSFCGPLPISTIRVSNMERAKETARLIAREMQKEQINVKLETPDPTLDEAVPAPMIPARPKTDTWVAEEIDNNRDRVEAAFQKYFYRETKDNESDDEELDEFEIVVCHGNLIRYFFCRALQIPPEAWLRMSIYNCSMTYLTIRPNGTVSARMLGDIGHLSYEESTYSGLFGFKW